MAVLEERQLFYNLLVGDALLIYRGVAYPLAGPFGTKADAEVAADALIRRLEKAGPCSAKGDLPVERPWQS